MERPKELPRVLLVGGGDAHAHAVALMAKRPVHYPLAMPPDQELKKAEPVIARIGHYFERKRRSIFSRAYPLWPLAPGYAPIIARLKEFYARRPRPWRPASHAPKVRRGRIVYDKRIGRAA